MKCGKTHAEDVMTKKKKVKRQKKGLKVAKLFTVHTVSVGQHKECFFFWHTRF